MLPTGNTVFQLDAMMTNEGNRTDIAPGSGHIVQIPLVLEDIAQLEHGYLIRHWHENV